MRTFPRLTGQLTFLLSVVLVGASVGTLRALQRLKVAATRPAQLGW
jgi:hypothetical protein